MREIRSVYSERTNRIVVVVTIITGLNNGSDTEIISLIQL